MTKIVGVRNIYRVLAACAYNANITLRATDLRNKSEGTEAGAERKGDAGKGALGKGDRLCIRAHGSEGWSLDTGGGL